MKYMLIEAQKIWDGFTFTLIKKAILVLTREGKIEKEGHSNRCDDCRSKNAKIIKDIN